MAGRPKVPDDVRKDQHISTSVDRRTYALLETICSTMKVTRARAIGDAIRLLGESVLTVDEAQAVGYGPKEGCRG